MRRRTCSPTPPQRARGVWKALKDRTLAQNGAEFSFRGAFASFEVGDRRFLACEPQKRILKFSLGLSSRALDNPDEGAVLMPHASPCVVGGKVLRRGRDRRGGAHVPGLQALVAARPMLEPGAGDAIRLRFWEVLRIFAAGVPETGRPLRSGSPMRRSSTSLPRASPPSGAASASPPGKDASRPRSTLRTGRTCLRSHARMGRASSMR